MGFAPSSLSACREVSLVEAPLVMPDWHAIKSRFDAAHALRRELASVQGAGFAAGSFVDAGRQTLDALRESSDTVNLTASANGKGHAGKEADVSGNPTPLTGECYD